MARRGETFTMTTIRHSCGHAKHYRQGQEPAPEYLDPTRPCPVCRIKVHAAEVRFIAAMEHWRQVRSSHLVGSDPEREAFRAALAARDELRAVRVGVQLQEVA